MNERSSSRGRSGITVIGNGSAAAPVDEVTVTLGVSVVRPDAGQAFQIAGQTSTRVLTILADDGADSRSVRTVDLSVGPFTQWRENREVLIGYTAGQRLIVHLPGLAGLERILSDVAMQGGEGVRIESVAFAPSDPAPALAQARGAAYADAVAKATQLADLAGRVLGDVTWIDESPGAATIGRGRVPFGPAAAKMPVATGDTLVEASVAVHWQFAE